MKELKGSKTEANLMAAFNGESQARNKYTFYAQKARIDGYEQIADIFEETASNEKEHAELWFKLLQGGNFKITEENLIDAANGENYEWTEMYKEFAEVAKEEGFGEIAFLFEKVGAIEAEHEKRYLTLLDNVKNGKVFEKDNKVYWKCAVCGNIIHSNSAPEVCPVCKNPKSKFEIKAENY